jgi:hypothetical protein
MMIMIYIVIAILGRASATFCKLGNKQPVVVFNVPVKGRWQEDACKFNQSSNSCVPTIRYNRVGKSVQTMDSFHTKTRRSVASRGSVS